MLGRLRQIYFPALAAALYAVAAIGLGFAHKPIFPTHADWAVAAIAEFGAAPICGASQDHSPPGDHAHSDRCDACALTSAPGLPPPAQAALVAPTARVTKCEPAQRAQFKPSIVYAPNSRGPPTA